MTEGNIFTPTSDPKFVYSVVMVIVCVVCAALANGLTQGLLSLDEMEMEIKSRSGTPSEKAYCKRVLPVIKNHHLLLVSLMLWNAAANESMPIFLDNLVPSYVSVILSVTMVLFMGEIIPASILTGPNQLQISSSLVPLVYAVEFFLFPIAWPIAKVLDCALGHEGMTVYKKKELKTLIDLQHQLHVEEGLHSSKAGRDNEDEALHKEEVEIIGGALRFRKMPVRDVMTPLNEVFMLSSNQRLTYKVLADIFNAGFSRIPVYYQENKNSIIGIILAKDLIFLDPADEPPLTNFVELFGRKAETVYADEMLGDTLNKFKKYRAHIAIVKEVIYCEEKDNYEEVVGIITLEDIIHQILDTALDGDKEERETVASISNLSRDMEFSRLRLLNSKLASDEKLTVHEISAIAAHLVSNVKQIQKLFGNNKDAVCDFIRTNGVVINVKRHSDNPNTLDHKDLLYTRGKVSNACLLILNGKVTIIVGKDEFKSEAGSWSMIAGDALIMAEGTYVPDFSAYTLSDTLRGLRLSVSTHMMRKSSKTNITKTPTMGPRNPSTSKDNITIDLLTPIQSPYASPKDVAIEMVNMKQTDTPSSALSTINSPLKIIETSTPLSPVIESVSPRETEKLLQNTEKVKDVV